MMPVTTSPKIAVGTLPWRVTIQRQSTTIDDLGQETGDWETLNTRWAGLRTLVGSELERARQLVPEATTEITIRYYADLLVTDRILFKDRIFNIGVINDMDFARVKMVLTCSEPKSV